MNTTKKKKILCFAIIGYLAVYFLFYFVILLDKCLEYADILTGANLIIVSFICFIYLGYHKDKGSRLKNEVFKTIIIILLVYFGLIYASGMVFGFLKNAYSLKLVSIVNNILAPVVIVVASEVFRYIMITNNKGGKTVDKVIIVLTTIILIVIDSSLYLSVKSFRSAFAIFKAITAIVISSITKNLTLTYLTYHVGYRPSLLYRIFADLYTFVVPVFPDITDAVKSCLGILLPVYIYKFSSNVIGEYNYEDEEWEIDNDYTPEIFSLANFVKVALVVVIVCLCSGRFSYFLVSIVSGSMESQIHIGDAVFVHRISSDDEIDIGDIIAFRNDKGVRVVHRIIRKDEYDDGYHYTTKGDANPSDDKNDLMLDDIKGKVLFKLSYVGYPAIWFGKLKE